jgi:Ran GTPase-activating protein (RanGAP) involved in mRNA processing and transport
MTQDEIIEMAKQANAGMLHGGEYSLFGTDAIERFAKLVAQHEREACAKIADQYVGQDLEHNFSALVAHNIRARGQV